MEITGTSKLNIPSLFGLDYAGIDDADLDMSGNVYISDGMNGRIYRIGDSGSNTEVLQVNGVSSAQDSTSLNIAVAQDSSIYLADTAAGIVTRYDEGGRHTGEFGVPGALALCSGTDGQIYVLSNYDDLEQINSYDQLGSMTNSFNAPIREGVHLDSALVNIDSDKDGSVFVCYGTPPYRIWKIYDDGSETETRGRALDYPEASILIPDIAVDNSTGILWVLLAYREYGRQIMDSFGPDGRFIKTVEIPQSDNLYSIICAADSKIYLIDTGTGAGSGDLLQLQISI